MCMGSLNHCIVACAHLGNGAGRRTVTMAATLPLLTSGPVKYEVGLHRNVRNFMCVCVSVCMPVCKCVHACV